MQLVLVGIGQSLRGDDGAGIAAIHYWRKTFKESAQHPQIRVELAELPGLALLDLLSDSRSAIIVDAVRSERPPGTVHLVHESELAAFTAGSKSAHGWGVAETLNLGRQLDTHSLPARISIIGIEVGQVNLGSDLSPQVQKALPSAARLIEEQVQQILAV
jgi:hydrogenase maturation protease